ncbi:MAG: hypothetical protein LUC97_06190 [Clostridiales bacterium]|nr:hypothetical protein [Clostridiales bacterium]
MKCPYCESIVDDFEDTGKREYFNGMPLFRCPRCMTVIDAVDRVNAIVEVDGKDE